MAQRYQRRSEQPQYNPIDIEQSMYPMEALRGAPLPTDPLAGALAMARGNPEVMGGPPMTEADFTPQIPASWKEAAVMGGLMAAPVIGQAAWKARGVPKGLINRATSKTYNALDAGINARGAIKQNPRSYQARQDLVDAEMTRVENAGGNPFKTYDPANPKEQFLAGRPEWQPTPKRLQIALNERNIIGASDDAAMLEDITSRISSVGIPAEHSTELAKLVMEATKPRLLTRTEEWRDVGYTADAIAHYIADLAGENMSHSYGNDTFFKIKSVIAGTANNPGIQLVMERSQGYKPPSQQVLQTAQQVLDAVMGGKAPKYPGVAVPKPMPSYKSISEAPR